jgi:DNA gyrase inhibitor
MAIKSITKEEYQRRINIVVEYINNNLDSELDLNKLAEISMLSPFHFHRIVRAFLGEPLGEHIIRIRMETAARLLRYTNLPIETIAYNIGYEVPSSLSKAFKQFYNITPREYRNNKNHIIMRPITSTPEMKLKQPKIIELEPKKAIYVHVTGAYNEQDYSGIFKRLWQCVKEENLFSTGIEHIGIYHDDPKVTSTDKLRADVCLVVRKPVSPKGEIGVKEIAGGKYAVFLYQGSYSNLGVAYDTIYSQWLPNSGYELRNVPMFEKYISNPERTAPEKLKTEIYIPLQ